MESLGEYLKREREFRHITPEEVANFTKYHISRIKALEEDRHDLLPPPPYVKGMLRSISKFLGLDVTDVLLRYEDFLKGKETGVSEKIGLPKIPFYKQRHFLTVAATAVFVVLSGVVFVLFYESKKIEPIGQVMMPAEKADAGKNAAPVAHTEYRLRLEAERNVWLKVQIDSDPPYSFYLFPGKPVELSGRKVIRFFVSDAAALKMIFNDKSLSSQQEGGPKTFVFPSDLKAAEDKE